MENLLSHLNNILYEKNIENMSFSYSTDGNSFYFSLNEIELFGWNIRVFTDDDPFDDDLIEQYENDIYTFEFCVFQQIKRNLEKIFYDIQNVTFKIFYDIQNVTFKML